MCVFFYASGFLRTFSMSMCTVIFAKDYSKQLADECSMEHTSEEWCSVVALHVSWPLPPHRIRLFAKIGGINIKAASEWERGGVEVTKPCCLSVIFWNAGERMAPLPSPLSFFLQEQEAGHLEQTKLLVHWSRHSGSELLWGSCLN